MLYGDQVAYKQCYVATVSTKAVMKKVQLIEEEKKMFKDAGRISEDKVFKDLVRY